MTKRVTILAGLILVLALTVFACAGTVECPIHDYAYGVFTGSRSVGGHLVGIYRCPRGHTFTARCD